MKVLRNEINSKVASQKIRHNFIWNSK